MRPRACLVLLVVATTLAGCRHYTTRVPGVLDMRSDGEGAERDRTPPPPSSRNDFMQLAEGKGVHLTAGGAAVEERHYWVLGVIPIWNESAREEIGLLVGKNALRRVWIGEEYTFADWALTFAATFLIAPAAWVMPPYTFQMGGQRVLGTPATPLPPVRKAPPPPPPPPEKEAPEVPPLLEEK